MITLGVGWGRGFNGVDQRPLWWMGDNRRATLLTLKTSPFSDKGWDCLKMIFSVSSVIPNDFLQEGHSSEKDIQQKQVILNVNPMWQSPSFLFNKALLQGSWHITYLWIFCCSPPHAVLTDMYCKRNVNMERVVVTDYSVMAYHRHSSFPKRHISFVHLTATKPRVRLGQHQCCPTFSDHRQRTWFLGFHGVFIKRNTSSPS